jgi:hypothetical protein
MAELMVMVDPSLYQKYVIVDSKGEAILYVQMHKALYGMLRSALLFYSKFVGDLEGEGYVINPYDPCVANKVINGKQCTVGWHVDDLKVSHVDPEVLTNFGKWLELKYGDCKEHRGDFHDYLGMELDYSIEGKVKVKITMIPFLEEMLDVSGGDNADSYNPSCRIFIQGLSQHAKAPGGAGAVISPVRREARVHASKGKTRFGSSHVVPDHESQVTRRG